MVDSLNLEKLPDLCFLSLSVNSAAPFPKSPRQHKQLRRLCDTVRLHSAIRSGPAYLTVGRAPKQLRQPEISDVETSSGEKNMHLRGFIICLSKPE